MMRSCALAGLAICGLLLAGCAALPPLPGMSAPPRQLVARKRVIVTLRPDTPEGWASFARGLQRDYTLRQVGAFPLRALGVQCLVLEIPDERPLPDVLLQLQADARVETAQINQIFASESSGTAVRPSYTRLQYAPRAIGADSAHASSTGKGIRIAVIDTGIDREHPDLRDRVLMDLSFLDDPDASAGGTRHGTAVAGIIAALDDGAGISGVAPDASILALKACAYPDPRAAQALCSSWSLAKAVDFAIGAGASVLNLSLAGPRDLLLKRVLEVAASRGISIVAAAAHGSADPGFPASFERAIAVVSSDSRGHIEDQAQSAERPLLGAPGIEVLTTVPDTAYDFQSGSSLAAAHVSGVIALILQRHPGLTPPQLAELLVRSARRDAAPGIGIVNACSALSALGPIEGCS